jgi:glycosyltransferase involved in cell wall biosynthesis
MLAAPRFSLVIPAYNEARRLPETLDRIEAFCMSSDASWESVVVVEKSRDQTAQIAAATAARQANFRAIINPAHRGKGFAVKTGMLAARGAIRFYMDADLSVPLPFIGEFLRYLDAHPEVAGLAGNRQHPASVIRVSQSLLRRSMGKLFNRILRAILRLPVAFADTQCGFKAFRADAAEAIFSRVETDGFAFDVEALLLARGLGYRIDDHPVEWNNSPESKVRIVRDSLRMLEEAAAIRSRMRESFPLPDRH